MQYLPVLAHLLHLSPREVDSLTWQEFDHLTNWCDDYLDAHRQR